MVGNAAATRQRQNTDKSKATIESSQRMKGCKKRMLQIL